MYSLPPGNLSIRLFNLSNIVGFVETRGGGGIVFVEAVAIGLLEAVAIELLEAVAIEFVEAEGEELVEATAVAGVAGDGTIVPEVKRE